MLDHIWEFIAALYKRSKWFTVLGAASTFSLPFPFLSAHVRWTVAAVALFSFITANFRLYMDQRREIDVLNASAEQRSKEKEKETAPATTLVLEKRQAHFTVSVFGDGSVILYVDCFFDFRNPGSPTTVRLLSSELPGFKTIGSMVANELIVGNRKSKTEPELNLLLGESGRLQCRVGIRIERGEWKDKDKQSITVKISLQETFTAPNIQTYTFAALRQA